MAAEIVEDDDVAGLECGDEELLDIGAEAFAVDEPVEDACRPQPRSGAMLVFAQVSSMNTRRFGSTLPVRRARWSHFETVDGAKPNADAIARMLSPALRREITRSQSLSIEAAACLLASRGSKQRELHSDRKGNPPRSHQIRERSGAKNL